MASPNGTSQTVPVPDNVVSSRWGLFWQYIADVVFSILVWVIVLLVVWGLHCCGDALGLRIIELIVVSFGTFWCVLFFLNATVRFIQKLKLQESIKEDKIGDIPSRFIETVSEQPIPYFICSIIVGVLLYSGISFAEISQRDSDDTVMLACEMLCETGPYFSESARDSGLEEILANYSKYLENKWHPDILKALTGDSAEGVITALQIVSDIDVEGCQEKAANDMWRAGENVMFSRLEAPKLLPRWIRIHEYRKIPEDLLTEIKDTLEVARKAFNRSHEKQSLESAVHLCEANRKTMLLLFLARDSGHHELLNNFQEIVTDSEKSKRSMAAKLLNDDPRKEFLELIADSEQRRNNILKAMKNRDTQKMLGLVWNAIEQSYARRTDILTLSSSIRNQGKYSERISPVLATR